MGIGLLAGYMAPAFTALIPAMIAGASFNIAQYVVTEAVHNRHPFAHGGRLLWSAGIGALSGGVDEPFRPTVIYRGRHPITRLPAATLWKRAWRDVTPGLRIAGLVRSGAAAYLANMSMPGQGDEPSPAHCNGWNPTQRSARLIERRYLLPFIPHGLGERCEASCGEKNTPHRHTGCGYYRADHFAPSITRNSTTPTPIHTPRSPAVRGSRCRMR